MLLSRELAVAEQAARLAGGIILRHYRVARELAPKADGTPVTRADLEADAAIVAALRAAFPGDGILSEESPDDPARLGRQRVWIVDPLDGTRGFVARTDDFAVHVGLCVDGIPTVGVVYQPVPDVLYRARLGGGAFRVCGGALDGPLAVASTGAFCEHRIGVSRHNAPAALLAWLEAEGVGARAVKLGASGKYMLLAEGALDAVVTITRTEKEWDTCAPELIVREAGGRVTDGDGRPLRYNQPSGAITRTRGVVASNGRCHDEIVARLAPVLA